MLLDQNKILNGLINGNEEAYEQLFRQYYAVLSAYSRRFVGRKDIAEEIVSETFVKIFENRKKLSIRTSLKSYLFQAVCNNSLYYLRKVKKEQSLEQFFNQSNNGNIGFAESSVDLPEESLLYKEVSEILKNAIELLPPQQKKVFKLKRFEGKKNREVAEELGLSIKTVEMHLSKALKFLRDQMKDYLPAWIILLLLS